MWRCNRRDRWALTDYYNAVSGKRIGFEGRAQMGGFAATMILQKYPDGLMHAPIAERLPAVHPVGAEATRAKTAVPAATTPSPTHGPAAPRSKSDDEHATTPLSGLPGCAAKTACTAKQSRDWHCTACRVGAAGPSDCMGGCGAGFTFREEFGDCTGECIKAAYDCHARTDATGGHDIATNLTITNESECRAACNSRADCWGYVVGNETADGQFMPCGTCWLKANPDGSLAPDGGGASDGCRKFCRKSPAPPPTPGAPPPPNCPKGCDDCVCSKIEPNLEVKRVHYVTMHHFDLGWDDTAANVLAMYLNKSGLFDWRDDYAPGNESPQPTGLIDRALDAIDMLKARGGPEGLVFTTWSYLIYLYLDCPAQVSDLFPCPSASRVARLELAISRGDVSWHANPLNSEDEVYDAETLGAAIDVSHQLDRRFPGRANRSGIGQQDDPGSTRGMIPVLASRGVLGMYIG